MQLASSGKGGGEVLEGALQPGEEEVEQGHQGDKKQTVPGPKADGTAGLGHLLLHHVQLPALDTLPQCLSCHDVSMILHQLVHVGLASEMGISNCPPLRDCTYFVDNFTVNRNTGSTMQIDISPRLYQMRRQKIEHNYCCDQETCNSRHRWWGFVA